LCLGRVFGSRRRRAWPQKPVIFGGAEIALCKTIMSVSPAVSDPTFESDPRFADPIANMPAAKGDQRFWGGDGLRFGDILDTINPLQHIPGVSTIYRNLTGDEMSPGARIAGGTIFGGPIGFISGLVSSAVEGATGRDLGDHILAMLPGDDTQALSAKLAAATPTPQDTAERAVAESITLAATETAPTSSNAFALAALQRDLQSKNVHPHPTATPLTPGQRNETPVPVHAIAAQPAGGGARNIFTVPLPPPSGDPRGTTQPDGRKPGEYSATELANILRAYQRAADTAAVPENTHTHRVED